METVMSATEVRSRSVRPEIVEIFSDVFQHSGPLLLSTSPDDIARWDSLQHIALVRMIESTFDVSLTMDEMVELRSVQDIESVLERHGV
jgi:acyl carrier protein